MKALSNGIATVEKYVAMCIMLAMAILIIVSVLFRYVFNAPLSWAGEVSVFLLVWTSFIGGSLGLKYRSQAAVTIALDYMPERGKKVIGMIGHVLMLLFLLLLLYYSYTWVFSPAVSFQKSTALLLPMWIPFSAVPISLTCAAVHITCNLMEMIRGEEAA
ncbi:TRAP transporter small permease [Brevibacillus sp. TJ4]|uniref:TRAP transporter small permease n=1 Tax=Brevibacillus sp. TJ4 TaxID=3234853 RepID=UPI003BA3D672